MILKGQDPLETQNVNTEKILFWGTIDDCL